MQCTIEFACGIPGTVVATPAVSDSQSVIVVELGPDSHLAVTNHSPHIRDLILDFQISYTLKTNIWAIIQAAQPVSIRMARLLSLGLEQDLLGPIAELLQVDSRGIPERVK